MILKNVNVKGEEESTQQVWMSHYDTVTELPAGFEIIATSAKVVGYV